MRLLLLIPIMGTYLAFQILLDKRIGEIVSEFDLDLEKSGWTWIFTWLRRQARESKNPVFISKVKKLTRLYWVMIWLLIFYAILWMLPIYD